MLKTLSLIVILSLLLLTIPSSAFSQSDLPQDPVGTAVEPTNVYIIGNGDVLEIVTWKEPDFSRDEIVVRLDGNISFPLLDDIVAAGRTPTQLKWDIENQLKDFVADPNVTVSVKSGASKRFYILGEVAKTGEYPLVKNLTVLQAFAIAGGFTEWASKKEIILFRREGSEEQVIRIDYRKIMKGKDFSQNVEIKADDTIIVP
jgi:polysaccharide export outer membrane protein